jgi:23S rRNA (guanine745-N1)-methyltransferase
VCRAPLDGDRTLRCEAGHSFDRAREGYVNLLIAAQRRSRQPGDNAEMVRARREFLATGAYDRIGDAIGHVVARAALAAHADHPADRVTILDVGCGDGYHTRRFAGNVTAGGPGLDPVDALIAGIDVSKPAVAAASRAHADGWYAVASAADIPLAPRAVDVAVNVFGPVLAEELARVVRANGIAIIAHPGAGHLRELRALVYADEARPHDTKDPLRHGQTWFTRVRTITVTFPMVIDESRSLWNLFAMTPYRWHGPPDMGDVLAREAERPGGFATEVDVIISSYRR